jgi:hypothetical protein
MSKKITLVLALGFLFIASGLAQNKALDFILHNKTGADIHAIHISPSDKNDWEENILKENVLADGESIHIQFGPHETSELWDLKVGDAEGTGLVWENLDLTKIHELTLKIVDGKAIAEIK